VLVVLVFRRLRDIGHVAAIAIISHLEQLTTEPKNWT
jgi:hypothetical protein